MHKALPMMLTGLLLTVISGGTAVAQLLHTPANMGVGGAGSAYTTGYESLFINPANLLIKEREFRLQVASAGAGVQIDSPLRTEGLRGLRSRYLSLTEGYRLSGGHTGVTDRDLLLERNYLAGQLMSEHPSSGEFHWFGLHWAGEEKSYAMAFRTRFANRYETGRGFYDSEPVSRNGTLELNRSLTHRFQALHEISFGYAESYSFLSGLIPDISRIIIGIAPKLVAGGSYLNAQIEDRYLHSNSQQSYRHLHSVNHYSAGALSEGSLAVSSSFPTIVSRPTREDLFRPTGFGAGVDLGLTWLMTIGDDLSVLGREITPEITRKSLRISVALTDIGLIFYGDEPAIYQAEQTEEQTERLPAVTSHLFEGAPGEHHSFLALNNSRPLLNRLPERDNFSIMLPASLHGGLLLQVNRFKVMADLSLGLTDNAFHSTRLISYLGIEVRPLSFLPLRAGMRTTPNLPDYYSFGAGIDLQYVELSAAIQLRSRSGWPSGEMIGASVGSLKIYLP